MSEICNDKLEYKNLIHGEWVSSKSGKLIKISSPVDGSFIGGVQAVTKDEVDDIVQFSKANFDAWSEVPIFEKADILYRAAELLEEREEEIANILMMEISKDKKSSISEVKRTADFLRFTADAGKSMKGSAVSGENFPGGSRNKLSYVKRVPLGTVLAISPFNYPINLSASKIAPALIGGNTVILKPATQGAVSALHLVKAINDAGLPDGVLQTVTGKGSEIGDYIVTHEGIDFINFTGSTEIGQHISKISSMTPLLLELGGKDAAIVLEDADLEFAANNIVDGAFSYSGQRCTAVKRIITTDKVADQLVDMLKVRIEKLSVGDPRENAQITPLIDNKSADFAESLINDAINKGAKIVIGNKRKDNLIYPTLIDYVTDEMEIAWKEPFSPILPIIRVNNISEAIEIANRSEYGLQSSVFTNDINKAFSIAEKLEVGTVQINNKTERGPDHFPFLGVKASGMGTQGVKYSIDAMTRPKAITVNVTDHTII
ncbi:glyceraldehyde-3-phosphate dehydrogenase (NADP+) [Mobilisporobacter senegalensis]|uniref:Glyceraldehyde-3-phosphate dehydrogenase (NADP+) n=1 Tax=Mobilisporobacter senegalensis TaxID=1329262 RepID=A0A3N1XM19_9FIRM|nr:NADP-dependent glyceraldehyde-3-phosphate dehydrogenase [Mobilisporobacter senegalensis]ROR27218.1 glyceraldehyde-3-phosphate dehydrogenase (NADP+) [Mobilisporobacter senegalensis]